LRATLRFLAGMLPWPAIERHDFKRIDPSIMKLVTGLQHQCVMIVGRPPLRVEGRPPLLHQVLRERLRQQLR
jgi:hypothetical protein